MKYTLILFIFISITLSGCAYMPYAREAKKKPREGGVIALKLDNRVEDQQKAQSMMEANCGSNARVKVLEEGEVVVGEKSSSTANKSNGMNRNDGIHLGSGFSMGGFDRPSERVNTVSETSQVKEWQISYICEPIKLK